MINFIGVDEKLVSKFWTFHNQNPHIFERFVDLAMEMKTRSGRAKYSAWTIINKIRWDEDLSSLGSVFTINNDFIALYARMAMATHPEQLEDFFELRRMKPDDRRESGEERYRLNRLETK
jgi:hypothetical protein